MRRSPSAFMFLSHKVVQLRRAVLVVTAVVSRRDYRRYGCLRAAPPEVPQPRIWQGCRGSPVCRRHGVLRMMGECTSEWFIKVLERGEVEGRI